MFLRRIFEWIDSLESGHQFRKWAPFFVKISGVFTLVITFVLAIVFLQSARMSAQMFTGSSGIVAQIFVIIKTLFGFFIIGIVGITTAILFWNRSKKITSLAEKSHLTFGSISGGLTRLFGEAAFITLNGIAILFLVYLLFRTTELGGFTLILLALSFLFHFMGVGFLQFSYVIADISTNLTETETTPSSDVTAATTPEAVTSDPPSEERPTRNNEERASESSDVTAATAPEAVTSDPPLEGKSTMNNEGRSPEIIAEQDAETHTNGYPYPESEGKLSIGWRLFLTLMTCGIYGIFWYSKQMQILNAWLGRETYSFWQTFWIGLLTCGVYNLYTEYQMARGIIEVRTKYGMQHDPNFPTVYMLLYFCTIVIGSFAIMQKEINKLYDEYPNG